MDHKHSSSISSSCHHDPGSPMKQMCLQILAKAGVDPREVVYLEAHGTGTVAGEVTLPIWMKSLEKYGKVLFGLAIAL